MASPDARQPPSPGDPEARQPAGEPTTAAGGAPSARRWLGLAAGGAALLGLAGGLRLLTFLFTQRSMLVAGKPGARTPAEAGVPYEPFEIASGRRRLKAWFVPARPEADRGDRSERGIALLVFHGRNESLSEWVEPLRYLWARGISSLVFDYSGFGASTGARTVGALRGDVQAAWREFRQRTAGKRRYVLGLSLGTGFLLDGVGSFDGDGGDEGKVDGVVLIAPYSSARQAAIQTKVLPAALSLLLPDPLNNVRAVRRLRAPLLVVYSRDDDLLPPAMAEEIHAAAPAPKRLVALDGLRHRDLLGSGSERVFAVVAEFLEETPPGEPRKS